MADSITNVHDPQKGSINFSLNLRPASNISPAARFSLIGASPTSVLYHLLNSPCPVALIIIWR